jgi:hypothetical protein
MDDVAPAINAKGPGARSIQQDNARVIGDDGDDLAAGRSDRWNVHMATKELGWRAQPAQSPQHPRR